jgi:nucleotide-binding universal stress UspA family protein
MNIVVGYDGSDPARGALNRAGALAGPDDRVTVVAVAEMRASAVLTEGAQLDPSDIHRQQQNLDEAKAALTERGVEPDTVLGQGDPGGVILSVAEDKSADLIVMGNRGLSQVSRLVLGSVSTKVIHRAECDVLIAKP